MRVTRMNISSMEVLITCDMSLYLTVFKESEVYELKLCARVPQVFRRKL